MLPNDFLKLIWKFLSLQCYLIHFPGITPQKAKIVLILIICYFYMFDDCEKNSFVYRYLHRKNHDNKDF